MADTALKIEEVITKANKGENLSRDEETLILQSEGAVPGYVNIVPGAEKPQETAKKEPEKKEEAEITVTDEDRQKHEGKNDDEIIEIKKAEAAKAKPEKKEEAPKEKKEEEVKDPIFLRLETELAKPEGQENLEGLSKEAKGYFYQMRKDRKARQDAERERDTAQFELLRLKKKPETEKKEEKSEEDPLKELKTKDPTDFISVGEVLKIMEGAIKKPPAAPEKKTDGSPINKRFFVMCDNEARTAHPEDYDAVMELTNDIIDKNEQYQIKVAEAWTKGENPAEVMYSIIKGDTEFAKLFPAAKIRAEAKKNAAKKPETEKKEEKVKTPEEIKKEEDAKKAEAALEKNQHKTKTTVHTSSEETTVENMTLEQYLAMSDRDFAALPAKVRRALLEKYGA